jgi:hypothetical protein
MGSSSGRRLASVKENFMFFHCKPRKTVHAAINTRIRILFLRIVRATVFQNSKPRNFDMGKNCDAKVRKHMFFFQCLLFQKRQKKSG